MTNQLSRRTALATAAVAVAPVLGGCGGSDALSSSDDSTTSCTGFDQESRRDPPLRNARVHSWNEGIATLRVTLVKSEIEATNARLVTVYEPMTDDEDPKYVLPINVGQLGPSDVSGDESVVQKDQAIGPIPATGRFRVEVEDEEGAVLAYKAFSFDCSTESEF